MTFALDAGRLRVHTVLPMPRIMKPSAVKSARLVVRVSKRQLARYDEVAKLSGLEVSQLVRNLLAREARRLGVVVPA